ncbi:MAG: helix-turn-helix domain-containing protein [Erythrobacteraceae bacterium]|nr:helix-turn-helix domain-containing protein [Erythrobacteraceae bacterium]
MPPFRPAHIRAWRQKRGMTMVELAAKAGMDQGHLSKLERGLLQYTQQNLESLAAALGVTPASLLESGPEKQ